MIKYCYLNIIYQFFTIHFTSKINFFHFIYNSINFIIHIDRY